jgi:hypothetical protein
MVKKSARNKRIEVRLDETEYGLLVLKAEEVGVTLSVFVRGMIRDWFEGTGLPKDYCLPKKVVKPVSEKKKKSLDLKPGTGQNLDGSPISLAKPGKK